jgi:hypothetical protein
MDRREDPRWIKAATLFSTQVMPYWRGRLPADPHAATNISWAVCMASTVDDDEHIDIVRSIKHYVGGKYQDALIEQCERVISSARAV